jgi:hypothetical protein
LGRDSALKARWHTRPQATSPPKGADAVLLRAHFGLHAARQGARQPASLVQAARAVISRRVQRRSTATWSAPEMPCAPRRLRLVPKAEAQWISWSRRKDPKPPSPNGCGIADLKTVTRSQAASILEPTPCARPTKLHLHSRQDSASRRSTLLTVAAQAAAASAPLATKWS